MSTGAERQESFRARMRNRGYTQVCEWVPNRDVPLHKELAAKAREKYAKAGEPDTKKPRNGVKRG